jgi:hypothetical protein
MVKIYDKTMFAVGLIVLILLILMIMIGTIWITSNHNEQGKKVDCYDSYGNKIEGMTCIQRDSNVGIGLIGFSLFLYSSVLIIVYSIMQAFSKPI